MPPDIVYNFDGGQVPVGDNFFDVTLCFDVLEHCEDPYSVFSELCRISSKYVIIALPNNWVGHFADFIRGHGNTIGYGLPPVKQEVGIRHKWFFNLEDAEKFLVSNASKNGYMVRELDYVFDPANNLIRCLWYPKINYLTDERIWEIIGDPEYRKYLGFWNRAVSKIIKIFGPRITFYLIKSFKLIFQFPFLVIDTVLKKSIWGWGSKFRYLNLFCRQIWIVLEKERNTI